MSRSSQALPGSLSSQIPVIDKPEACRFPPPWSVEEDRCFIVKDSAPGLAARGFRVSKAFSVISVTILSTSPGQAQSYTERL
jgi:hypothetical protein